MVLTPAHFIWYRGAWVAKWWEHSPSSSGTRLHMWVEFIVGCRPCSEGFSWGSPVLLHTQKPTFLNSNSTGNLRAKDLSVEDCCVSPSLIKVNLSYIFVYCILSMAAAANEWLSSVSFDRIKNPMRWEDLVSVWDESLGTSTLGGLCFWVSGTFIAHHKRVFSIG